MLRKLIGHLILSTVFAALMSGSVFADEFHYNNFIIGDRASGMGGAYTAVSDDPSGLYYNPAGVVYSTGKNLSASVNAYYNQHKKYDNVIGGRGWERNSSALLPNFFGITQPLGKFQFGFSYAVPDSTQENQSQDFANVPTTLGTATQYIINFRNDDNTYNFGPSLAYQFNDRLSAGMTLYLHHRSRQTILNQLILVGAGNSEWTNEYIDLVERGYKPILGIMWSPADKWTVGLSIAKTFLYSESMTVQSTKKDGTLTDPSIKFDGNGAQRKYPYEVRGGIAYFASSSLLVSADGAYYAKVSDPVYGDRVSVLNGAIGTEYYLDKNWAVRGGLFTNLANTPKLDSARSGQDEKVDFYGVSASISNFSRNTSITFGGNYSMGSGKAQIISGTNNIQSVDAAGWMIFLSSSYSY